MRNTTTRTRPTTTEQAAYVEQARRIGAPAMRAIVETFAAVHNAERVLGRVQARRVVAAAVGAAR